MLTIVGFFALWTVLLTVKYVYRLWFHPLASFPGPLLARTSSIWQASAARKLRKAQVIQQAHERYGPVVRVAPNELSFSDPKLLKAIYGHGARLPKTEFYAGGKFTSIDNVFSMRNIEQHSGRRAVMAPVFSQRYVSSFIPLINEKIAQTFDQMAIRSKEGKEEIDIYHWVHSFSLDVVFHFTLNHESGTLSTGRPHAMINNLEDFQSVFAWTALFPPLRSFGLDIPISAINRPFVSLKKWITFCLDVTARERSNDKKASFINRLLEIEDQYLGRRLNDLEVAEELIGIMFAGSGTAANTIVFLIWAVLQDFRIHHRLVEELQSEVKGDEPPSYQVVSKLPYLNAVIMETLRRYPTISGMQTRKVVGQDLILGEHRIPIGTTIGVQNFSVHLDPVAYPNPSAFYPERWLEKDASAPHDAFNAFGTGPRACIGRNLAMIELQLFVAAFFLRFSPKISPNFKNSDMEMTDGFSGGPAGKNLPLYLTETNPS